jgi:hypothetical protein
MDTTREDLCPWRREAGVVADLEIPTRRAFRHLGPNNPLKRLAKSDQKLLWSFLKVFSVASKGLGKQKPEEDELEKLAGLIADAGAMAAKLESAIFKGPYSDLLYAYTSP